MICSFVVVLAVIVVVAPTLHPHETVHAFSPRRITLKQYYPIRQRRRTLVSSTTAQQSPAGLRISSSAITTPNNDIIEARDELIERLRAGEDENSPLLEPYIKVLREAYEASNIDARCISNKQHPNIMFNGDWMNINTPDFPGRLDFDRKGYPMYTIGTLTFNLIPAAKHVVCSVSKMSQIITYADEMPPDDMIPPKVLDMVKQNPNELRLGRINSYIEIVPRSGESNDNDNNPPVKGILQASKYLIPNPTIPNRFESWFFGGRCFAQDDVADDDWESVFGNNDICNNDNDNNQQATPEPDDAETEEEECRLPESSLSERLSYTLAKPFIGYSKILYLDDDFRITMGNRGSIMINGRDEIYSKLLTKTTISSSS